jgi:hypothetical protein
MAEMVGLVGLGAMEDRVLRRVMGEMEAMGAT